MRHRHQQRKRKNSKRSRQMHVMQMDVRWVERAPAIDNLALKFVNCFFFASFTWHLNGMRIVHGIASMLFWWVLECNKYVHAENGACNGSIDTSKTPIANAERCVYAANMFEHWTEGTRESIGIYNLKWLQISSFAEYKKKYLILHLQCYNAAINECCPPLRCHGYYHHCVT